MNTRTQQCVDHQRVKKMKKNIVKIVSILLLATLLFGFAACRNEKEDTPASSSDVPASSNTPATSETPASSDTPASSSEVVIDKIVYGQKTPEKLGRKVRITCIGDSLTYGAKSTNPATKSYPVKLGEMLGGDYVVTNCGKSSAYAYYLAHAAGSYIYDTQMENALESNPDIVIVMLGTNDANPYNKFGSWQDTRLEGYIAGMDKIIGAMRDLESKPDIYICTSPWIQDRSTMPGFEKSLDELIPIQKKYAADRGYKLIDVYTQTVGKDSWYAEGLHFNDVGYEEIAKIIYNGIDK